MWLLKGLYVVVGMLGGGRERTTYEAEVGLREEEVSVSVNGTKLTFVRQDIPVLRATPSKSENFM